MIDIQSPHMGLNDERAPVFVQMWNTWKVTQSDTKSHIIEWVAHVAQSAPGGKLKELVISCHGAPGYLQLGQGFGQGDVELFRGWNGLVDKIWLRACLVARIIGPGTAKEGDGAFLSALNMQGNGDAFCKALAKAAGCYVVAATELQSSRRYGQTWKLPYGKIDTYEGLVLSYNPDGTVGWSQRYPSVYNADPKKLTARNPNWE